MKLQSIDTKIKLLMAGLVISLAFSTQCIAQGNNAAGDQRGKQEYRSK